MEVFRLTLEQMLLMFLLMAAGYVLRKKMILPVDAHVTMSKLANYILAPALTLYTQMTNCTVETFKEHSGLLLTGLIIALCAAALSFPVSRLLVPRAQGSPQRTYQRCIYQYASTFSNYGFMGNFIILNLWGSQVLFQYGLFTFFLSVMCNSWGIYLLIPKDQNAGLLANLRRGLLTPPLLAMVIGVTCGLLDLRQYVPEFVLSALNNAGACQGPIAMLLAGFVVGSYDFKKLMLNARVYAVSFVRLLLIPTAVLLTLRALGVDRSICLLALIAYGMPLGLNTIVIPSAYGGDPETGASMTMVSHALSVLTVPLMFLLLP